MRTLVLLCLCMMTLVSCQSAESLQRERDYDAWERSLSPDQRVRLEAARLQALGFALSGGPIFHQAPSTTYMPPMNSFPQRLNCFENEIGDSVYTNCY